MGSLCGVAVGGGGGGADAASSLLVEKKRTVERLGADESLGIDKRAAGRISRDADDSNMVKDKKSQGMTIT